MSLRLPLLLAAAVALLVAGAGVVGANRGAPSPVMWFEHPLHEPGPVAETSFAVQQRGYFSITTQIHSSGLTPGHRYTVWWAIYNDPAACGGGCGFDDLTAVLETGEDFVGIGVHYGGTFIAPASGNLHSGTRILEHQVTTCQKSPPFNTMCKPMIDAAIAEASLFIQDHGPATGEPIVAQDAFHAGCKTYTRLGTVVHTYATTGFDCFSAQIIHLP